MLIDPGGDMFAAVAKDTIVIESYCVKNNRQS